MTALEVQSLRKAFMDPDGAVRRVVDVDRFALGDGEQAALRGPSGSGKTTFLHLIAGILQPDGGSIWVAGIEMTALGEPARDRLRAASIGYVFQTWNLLQGYTAIENILLAMAFGGGVDEHRALELLSRVGLADRAQALPRALSSGQQQRVAIARALANRPRLVLADEPTANLDAAHGERALALLREACSESGAALLLVSHDSQVLGGFDRVGELTVPEPPTAEIR